MERFIHKSVRLSCDINRAMRMFLVESQASKWLDGVVIENKVGGDFLFEFELGEQVIPIKKGCIVKKEFEKIIKIDLCVPEELKALSTEKYWSLEINFMQGTSRTEYCTEIHLIQRNFDSEMGEAGVGVFDLFWAQKLEKLRVLINGDWIIEDRDLNRSFLMGGRL